MSIRFTLDSDDNYSCENGYGDFKMSHSMLVSPEFTMTNEKSTCPDSNCNCGSECNGGSSRAKGSASVKAINGWKILAAVALHAWRRRRKEFKEAMNSVEKLQMESACSKSQLQVYSTLIKVEQKRNEELTRQLKRTLSNLDNTKSSCETISATLISLKADKALLEQELKVKYEEYDALHSVLAQTKTDLFRSMMEMRTLQSQLSNEQRTVQTLENQKNQLINEICDMNSETHRIEETFKRQIEDKQQQLNEMKDKLKLLEPTLDELNGNLAKEQVSHNSLVDDGITDEINDLRCQVASLQSELNESFSSHLRVLWNIFVSYQKKTLRFVHVLAFYLLPATPMPLHLKLES